MQGSQLGAGRAAARARRSLLACAPWLAAARLWAQCPDGTPPPCGAPSTSPNSVAVLAFRNVTQDSAFAYLSEGLSGEISTSLSGVGRLEVRSPGVVRSVQQDGGADPRALGRRLNVRYVVEGEYQRGGDRIRVAVRLVTVATGTQRWSSAWTRSTTDLLAVQEEIAQAVASSIAGQLLPAERTALASGTTDPQAWDAFLRGNYALRRRELPRALAAYGEAVARDSAFARARAGIAYVYGLLADRDQSIDALPAESLLARGTRAADQALAMDARSSDAWMARAMLAEAQDPLTLAGAREDFERAVALDPRNAEAWHQYGSVLAYLGRDSAAFAAWHRALELDPSRPQTLGEIARLYYYERRFVETLTACRDTMVVLFSSGECAMTLAYTGDTAHALAAVDSLDRQHGHPHPSLRARITGRPLGLTDPWVRSRLAEPRMSCYQLANQQGPVYLAAGYPDSAIALLAGCTPRGPKVWFFLRDPAWDPARSSSLFQQLVREARPAGAREP